MKRYLWVPLIGVLAILAGCSGNAESDAGSTKEYVAELSAGNIAESASIDSESLMVTDDSGEQIYDLPNGEFFVSIAPFITYTHPCSIHSLTGCQGELVNADMDVKITDDEGNVHVDETVTTLDNGFMDFWLPSDKNYTIDISYDGKGGSYEFSTFEGDSTCLTDLQLK
ncbi:hypothetical protein WN59_12950 [Salinicoccus sediminis]|uniref:Uncharacterized protein n=1 Tax=Salinicoccus sediminis TaxID=1432562 RepID=A0A0M2SK45_9STAP|nr:CueP family metal-binding protein [Salinicoccus sediminis]KKK32945.1 hypothetical protein WN59_12950 [Salinicoccus sediminis]